jgi:transposase
MTSLVTTVRSFILRTRSLWTKGRWRRRKLPRVVRPTRTALCARRLRHTIPERSDQVAYRARRGSAAAPPVFDPGRYEDRNVVEPAFARLEQFRVSCAAEVGPRCGPTLGVFNV